MIAVALPNIINSSQLFRVTSTIVFCVAALSFNASHIQAIEFCPDMFSGLLQVASIALNAAIECFYMLTLCLVIIGKFFFSLFYTSQELDDLMVLLHKDLISQAIFYTPLVLKKIRPSGRVPRPTKSLLVLSKVQEEVIIGVMLGDGHLEQSTTKQSARLILDQKFPDHAFYLTTLYVHLWELFGTAPRVVIRKPDKRAGRVYSSFRCATLQQSCLQRFHEMFYNGRKKEIPSNIGELLTARVLAHWIMDDGAKGNRGETILHSESFTLQEVNMLQQALLTNFSLRTRLIEKYPGQWVIVVPLKQEVKPLREIVSQYMCVSMMHKI